MTLNTPIYVITDAAGRILGDGQCKCIYEHEPTVEEVESVRKLHRMYAHIVKARIVEIGETE